MVKKILPIIVMVIALAMLMIGCGDDKQETANSDPVKEVVNNEPEKDLTEAEKIEKIIRDRVIEKEYRKVEINEITINENLGTEEDGDYIALVYLDFNVMNPEGTGNKMMRMYSDDLVANLANSGIDTVCEAAVFWKDDYNNRNLKYAYEYENGGFYITDIAGE